MCCDPIFPNVHIVRIHFIHQRAEDVLQLRRKFLLTLLCVCVPTELRDGGAGLGAVHGHSAAGERIHAFHIKHTHPSVYTSKPAFIKLQLKHEAKHDTYFKFLLLL